MHDLRLFHSYCRFLNLTGAPQWLGACFTPLFYSSLSLVIYLQVETFVGTTITRVETETALGVQTTAAVASYILSYPSMAAVRILGMT